MPSTCGFWFDRNTDFTRNIGEWLVENILEQNGFWATIIVVSPTCWTYSMPGTRVKHTWFHVIFPVGLWYKRGFELSKCCSEKQTEDGALPAGCVSGAPCHQRQSVSLRKTSERERFYFEINNFILFFFFETNITSNYWTGQKYMLECRTATPPFLIKLSALQNVFPRNWHNVLRKPMRCQKSLYLPIIIFGERCDGLLILLQFANEDRRLLLLNETWFGLPYIAILKPQINSVVLFQCFLFSEGTSERERRGSSGQSQGKPWSHGGASRRAPHTREFWSQNVSRSYPELGE